MGPSRGIPGQGGDLFGHARVTACHGRVTKRDGRVTKRNARVTKRDARVTMRDARVTKRDARVTKRDGRVTKRDARVTKRDGTVLFADGTVTSGDGTRMDGLLDAVENVPNLLTRWSEMDTSIVEDQLEDYENKYLEGEPRYSGILRHGPDLTWQLKRTE